MKVFPLFSTISVFFIAGLKLSSAQENPDSLILRNIYNEILLHGECHENLRVLCKDVGNRLSGSEGAEKAVIWGRELLTRYEADSVWLQEVMVPNWKRGCCERGEIRTAEEAYPINICALGGSVGTSGILEAEVVEVKYLEELAALGREKVEGKLVFYNRPLDPLFINTGAAYGGAFDQRSRGASEAAKYGAVGTLVRSLTLATDTFPHTGAMNYEEGVRMIPASAISTSDARLLHALLRENPLLRVSYQLNCERLPDVPSANVIAELRGSEFPDRYIVVGGHLDSWDIGEGAHDDGAGIVQSIEVLRTFLALGIKPRHTIRIVLFMNEENGVNGGKTYAREASENHERHIAAIESDAGGFTPRGFRMDGEDQYAERFKSWAPLFEPYDLHIFSRGFAGVDIAPLKSDTTPLFGLAPDSQRYFDFHHSERDVWENVHKRELELGAAALSSLVYLIDRYGWD